MNAIRTRTETRANESVRTGIDSISKGAIALMGGTSALVGLWATACMAVAVLSSGPVAVVTGWFTSVAG